MLSGIYTHFTKKKCITEYDGQGWGGVSMYEFVDRDGPLDDNEPIHEW